MISSTVSIKGISFGASGSAQPSITTNWSGSLALEGSSTSTIADLTVAGGTVSIAAGGTLAVTTFTDAATNLAGPGTFTISAGGTATLTDKYPELTKGLTLVNEGTLSLPANETLYFSNGSHLLNEGQVVLGVNTDLCDADGAGNSVVNEVGATLTSEASDQSPSRINAPFLNLGTVSVRQGTLDVLTSPPAGSTDGGTWSAAQGGTLAIGPHAVRTFTASNVVSGAGTLEVNGTVNVQAQSGVTVANQRIDGRYVLAGGVTLTPKQLTLGTGTLTASGAGAKVSIGSGDSFSIAPTNGPAVLSGVAVQNAGALSVSAGSTTDLSSSVTIANSGIATIGDGATLTTTDASSTSLSNLSGGSLSTSGAASIDANLFNAGLLTLNPGVVRVLGSFLSTAGATTATVVATTNGATASGELDATSAVLAGSLHLLATGTPYPGASVDVVRASTSGSFSATTGTSIDGSELFVVGQDANGVVLTAESTPTITSPSTATFPVNTPSTFTFTATGYPAPTFTESGTLPTGITLNPTTGVLSGTTTQTGTWPMTITVSNGNRPNGTQSFVLVTDAAPAFTSAPSTSLAVGAPGSFSLAATGYPSPAYAVAGTLPPGISLNPSTGLLEGTPTSTGTYPVTVTATNSAGTATKSLTIVVTQTPSISSPATATFTKGVAASFSVVAAGYPAPTFTESGTLPTGITLDPTTGVLSGTTTQVGTWPMTITASNGARPNATQTFTLYVVEAPAITSSAEVTFQLGTASSFAIGTTGYPAPTFTEVGNLPQGGTFDDGTGVLSGTPATTGTFDLTITASSTSGATTQSLILTVEQRPSITSASSTTFTTGSAASFTFTATGYPAPTFTESGTLPTGITLNPTTGVLSGTTNQVGTWPMTITASNGDAPSATQSFVLSTISLPVFTSSASVTFTVGTPASFTVTSSASPSATYTLSGLMPPGLYFNGATGVISGTPTTAGVYSYTLTATNSAGTTTQAFSIANDEEPSITSAPGATFTVGAASSYAIAASGFPAPAFSLSGNLPQELSFNAATGALSGTPAPGTGGTYRLTVSASNGVGVAPQQSFLLMVEEAPAITSAPKVVFTYGVPSSTTLTSTGFPAATYTLDGLLPSGLYLNGSTGAITGTPNATGTFTYTLTATNAAGAATQSFSIEIDQTPVITSAAQATFTDGVPVTFTATASGSPAPTFTEVGALPAGLSLLPSGTWSGTPTQTGTFQVTLTATSSAGSSTQVFTLKVVAAPRITSAAAATFTSGVASSFTITATGYPAPTFSAVGLPNGLSLSSTTGLLSGAATQAGTFTVTLTATSTAGVATQTFTLTVLPLLAITSANSATFTVGTPGSFSVVATGAANLTYIESGTLPTGITLNPTTGVLSGTTTQTGIWPMTITVSTPGAAPVTQSFTLTTNQLPVITSSASTSMTQGSASSFTVTTLGYPSPVVTITGALPAGLSFSSSTAMFSGTPLATGTYALTVTATSAAGTTSQSFMLTVGAPPAITSSASVSMPISVASSFTVSATGFPAPTFSESGTLPTGITLNPTTGVLSGTTTQTGTWTVAVRASNGFGADATQYLTLVTYAVPAITSAATIYLPVGVPASTNLTATGYPSPTFSLNGTMPSGLYLNSTTGAISGTPTVPGTSTYTLSASNIGGTVTETFTIVVTQAPLITSNAAGVLNVGRAGSFTVAATGYPAPTFTESGTLPTGITFNPSTGVLGGTTTQTGIWPLTITASNGVGPAATQSFTLTTAQGPSFTSASSTTMAQGVSGSFSFAATGFPSPTFSLAGTLPAGLSFNASTGVLSGIPTSTGTTTLTVTASNAAGSVVQSFSLTVSQAPTFTNAASASFATGTASTFQFTTTGFPAATYTESGTLPTGISFNGTTGVLSGTTTQSGTWPITVTASNGTKPNATLGFTLTTGAAAQITSAASALFGISTYGSFTVTATGAGPVTLSEVGALPPGLSFNASSGVLSGTPTKAGSFTVTFMATNAINSTSQTFTVVVASTPVFTSASSVSMVEGAQSSFAITATGTPSVTYSVIGGSLPPGLTLNSSTGVLSGAPTQLGSFSVDVEATTDAATLTDAFQLFTVFVGTVPQITSANSVVFDAGAFNIDNYFAMTATGSPAPSFSETGQLPAGVTLNSYGQLTGTAATSGTFPITVTATSALGTATQSFTLNVATVPQITSASTAAFVAGQASSFSFTATGTPSVTYSIISGQLPSGLSLNPSTGVVSGTTSQVGTYYLTLQVNTATWTYAQHSFVLSVVTPPQLTSTSTATFTHGSWGGFQITVSGTPTPSVTLTGALPAGLSFNSGDDEISGTPANPGTATVTVTASSAGGSVTQTLTIRVL